jgi:predicted secreted Zn-dependent protease
VARLRVAGCFFIDLVAALYVAASALAAPAVTETIDYYDVRGSTPQEVRAQLDRLGPIDATEGKRFDADTRWFVNWKFNYMNAGQGCAIASVSTTLKVTITLPRLQADASTPAALKQVFATFTNNLLLHEKGHAQNGIDIARRIEERIGAMPPERSCDGLGQAANELGHSLIKAGNRQDIDYDARTQHGRTQGARFP